ncbi:hypothetical protein ACLOJK_006758 [Asimina triloba]
MSIRSSRSRNCRDHTQRMLEISPLASPSSPASPVPSTDADDRARRHDRGLDRTIQAAYHDDHREDVVFTVRLQQATPATTPRPPAPTTIAHLARTSHFHRLARLPPRCPKLLHLGSTLACRYGRVSPIANYGDGRHHRH